MKSMKRLSSICMSLLMVMFIVLSPISVLAEEQVDLNNDPNETIVEDNNEEQNSEEEAEQAIPETEETDQEDTELELEYEQENTNLDKDASKSDSKNDEERSVEINSTSSKVEEAQVTEEQVESQTEEIKDYTELIQSAIDRASALMIEEGVNSEWEAIGLVQAGKEVPEHYDVVFEQNIISQITNGLENGRIKITDIERLAMAAVAIDKNPQNVYGHNLIELIYNSPNHLSGSDTMTFQGNNGPIFALIALDTKDFDVPDNARWTRQKLIDELLNNQNDDGSWSLFGSTPSYDITAMAIIALGGYQADSSVREAIENAVSFLAESQSDEGGFNDPWNGGVSLETAAQVMIGLTAANIDPLGDNFTKDNGNLLDHILSFLHEDGGFKHLPDDKVSNGMATEQGLQALIAYQFFLEGKGSLYQFEEIGTPPVDPEPEPEDPELPEEPNPEKPKEEEKQIELGKEVQVEQEDEIVIADSRSKVTMPKDLPSGTKLSITKPEKKTVEQPIKPAGDIFNFNLVFPNGEKPEGTFTLTLAIDDDADIEKTGIYYYNEKTQLWEYVGGKGTAKDGLITLEVEHFSTYGVFEAIEDEEDEEDEEENEEETNGEESSEEENEADQNELGNNNDSDNNKVETNEDDQSVSEPIVNEGDSSNQLPATATNSFNLLLVGFMLIVFGLNIFIRKKKYVN